MTAVARAKKGKDRHLPMGIRPVIEIGEHIRALRKSRDLNQRQLAEMLGTHFSQVSLIENGANVEAQWYERIAVALKFKNALEMFAAGSDDLTRRMLRLWKRLPDDEARKEVLDSMRKTIAADMERDAT